MMPMEVWLESERSDKVGFISAKAPICEPWRSQQHQGVLLLTMPERPPSHSKVLLTSLALDGQITARKPDFAVAISVHFQVYHRPRICPETFASRQEMLSQNPEGARLKTVLQFSHC